EPPDRLPDGGRERRPQRGRPSNDRHARSERHPRSLRSAARIVVRLGLASRHRPRPHASLAGSPPPPGFAVRASDLVAHPVTHHHFSRSVSGCAPRHVGPPRRPSPATDFNPPKRRELTPSTPHRTAPPAPATRLSHPGHWPG